ncbi:MAG: acetate--CoA ligase family protein [Nitrospirae bacterium]|nr:acetate--CoA ligase family protein [Nitrospirota bacterium]
MREAEIIRDCIGRDRGRKVFLEHEVKGLLAEMGLPVPRGTFLRKGETLSGKPDLAYPLAVKVSSEKIASKTDVGGVKIGIGSEEELRLAVQELSRIEHAEGVLVEEMAPPGLEVIIGGITDSQFGPVVMFGLGGVFVEVFKDVSFGLAPLTPDDARWVISQIKGHVLLGGYRGGPPLDKDRLTEMIVSVSEVMATGLVGEIDLNPVALYADGAMILDAKMQTRA